MEFPLEIRAYDPENSREIQFDVLRLLNHSYELKFDHKVAVTEEVLLRVLSTIDSHAPGQQTTAQVAELKAIFEPLQRVVTHDMCPLSHQAFISAFHIGKKIGIFLPQLFDDPALHQNLDGLRGRLCWQGRSDCFLYFLDSSLLRNESDVQEELYQNGLIFTAHLFNTSLGLVTKDFVPYYPATDYVSSLSQAAQLKWQEIVFKIST